MNDVEDAGFRDAFSRLGSALSPPDDAGERVEKRIRVRRRHRRVALAGVAALAVAGVTSVALALGAGDGSDAPVAEDTGGPASSLVLTRPDGSTYEFDDLQVSCDPPTSTAGDPLPGQPGQGRIWLWSPIEVSGRAGDDDRALLEPYVLVEARSDAFTEPRTLSLPFGPPGERGRAITVFVADPGEDGGASGVAEVSSSPDDSQGTIRVLRASCDPTPVLELEVDATLGSEVEGPAMRLEGAAG